MKKSGYDLIDGEEVWNLHATHGFTVDVSIPLLADRGYIPTWDKLVKSAERDDANRMRLIARLKIACEDAYEPDISRKIKVRLDALGVFLDDL